MIKLKKIISSIVFVFLLVLAIRKCADILEYKEARKEYTPFFESETNFDVVFLGTSHMWNHVLPMEMWDEYGIASYNWGYANSTPAENYYLIQDILKYTSPKVVVIDIHGIIEYDSWNNGKYHTDRIEQQHVQFDELPLSRSKIMASKDVFDDYDDNEDFIWNFIMYHNRWSELDQSDFDYEITTEKGSSFMTGLGERNFATISNEQKTEINSVCYPYFLKTLEYCEQQNIQVLCICTYAVGEMQQRVANTMGDIIDNYPNCQYVNMLTADILNFNTDVYSDNNHLNYSGALKTTLWLGQYLSENYNLSDYSGYASWSTDYLLYYDYKVETLKSQKLLVNYLVRLADTDFSVSAEIYDSNLMDSDRLMLLFDNANISPVLSSTESESCAKLVITSQITGEVVEEVNFTCKNSENLDIFSINKVEETE